MKAVFEAKNKGKSTNKSDLPIKVEGTRNRSTFVTDVEAIINAKNIIDKVNGV